MTKLTQKKQLGGSLYKVDNTSPQITQRYVVLLNKGIYPQVAFDTAHLSMIEDGRPGKYYSFGKKAIDLEDWAQNAADSLTVGRYKNLQNARNFGQFKQGLKQKNYNSRPAFYNIEMNRGRAKDRQIINQWNRQNGISPIVSIFTINKNLV